MSIKNITELETDLENLFRTGHQLPKPTELKHYLRNLLESNKRYSLAMNGSSDNFSVTATPTKFDNFTLDTATDGGILMSVDSATDRFIVEKAGMYFISLIFNGAWNGGEDLTFEVRVDGAVNFYNPVIFNQEGKGTNDPTLLAVTQVAFPLGSALFFGGPVDVELYLSSTTGTFSLTQISISMGIQYEPLTRETF